MQPSGAKSSFLYPNLCPDPELTPQVIIGGRQAGRLSRDGPFNVSLGPADAYLGASDKDEELRLDIVVEGLFRSNEGWRFDTKGLASPHVLWNGTPPNPLQFTGHSHTYNWRQGMSICYRRLSASQNSAMPLTAHCADGGMPMLQELPANEGTDLLRADASTLQSLNFVVTVSVTFLVQASC